MKKQTKPKPGVCPDCGREMIGCTEGQQCFECWIKSGGLYS